MILLLLFTTLALVCSIIYIFKLKNEVNELRGYDSTFFKSKQAELLFYFTNLEGKQRNRLIGLTDEHYANKTLAEKWYKDTVKYVHPDKGGNEKAFIILKKIYDILVEEDEE